MGRLAGVALPLEGNPLAVLHFPTQIAPVTRHICLGSRNCPLGNGDSGLSSATSLVIWPVLVLLSLNLSPNITRRLPELLSGINLQPDPRLSIPPSPPSTKPFTLQAPYHHIRPLFLSLSPPSPLSSFLPPYLQDQLTSPSTLSSPTLPYSPVSSPLHVHSSPLSHHTSPLSCQAASPVFSPPRDMLTVSCHVGTSCSRSRP